LRGREWDAEIGLCDHYHWVHQKDNVNPVAPILESERAALENRIWCLYPNQIGAGWEGDWRQPSEIARWPSSGRHR